MANNDNFKKMYKNGAQVGIVALAESGTQTPANIESWTLDDYGKPTSIVIKDGVTSIPNDYQRYNYSLTAVTLPNSITRLNSYAFQYCVGGLSINIPTGITTGGDSVFDGTIIRTDLTFPASTFTTGSGGSGYTANWQTALNNADLSGHTVTIENGVDVIPRGFIKNAKNYTIVVPSSVTFLSPSCFGSSSSASGSERIVEFLGDTPPTEVSTTLGSSNSAWYALSNNYLQGLRIIVPNSYSVFNAYKKNFPEVADYIERKS